MESIQDKEKNGKMSLRKRFFNECDCSTSQCMLFISMVMDLSDAKTSRKIEAIRNDVSNEKSSPSKWFLCEKKKRMTVEKNKPL